MQSPATTPSFPGGRRSNLKGPGLSSGPLSRALPYRTIQPQQTREVSGLIPQVKLFPAAMAVKVGETPASDHPSDCCEEVVASGVGVAGVSVPGDATPESDAGMVMGVAVGSGVSPVVAVGAGTSTPASAAVVARSCECSGGGVPWASQARSGTRKTKIIAKTDRGGLCILVLPHYARKNPGGCR